MPLRSFFFLFHFLSIVIFTCLSSGKRSIHLKALNSISYTPTQFIYFLRVPKVDEEEEGKKKTFAFDCFVSCPYFRWPSQARPGRAILYIRTIFTCIINFHSRIDNIWGFPFSRWFVGQLVTVPNSEKKKQSFHFLFLFYLCVLVPFIHCLHRPIHTHTHKT